MGELWENFSCLSQEVSQEVSPEEARSLPRYCPALKRQAAPDPRRPARHPKPRLQAPDLRLQASDPRLQAPDLRLQASDPRLQAPDLASPGLPSAGLASPGLPSTGLASPGLTSVGLAFPSLTSAGSAQTSVSSRAGFLRSPPGGEEPDGAVGEGGGRHGDEDEDMESSPQTVTVDFCRQMADKCTTDELPRKDFCQ
ncbi:hypothetical protein NHX12_026431 [Muraenolepis orangiensis]|uniref:Uncharacterized protein n=1 Tax=Muraenolepis orangiensis TaxID=630683 RepID=A0A9Q0EGI3_9TELE|nr:hypothetical protein NHX12_026431 [Muraenolepis orangiensis]